jgi:2',3'-cyclic-nucleotide 2'-phosphodiesterase (5'-nucleotidase family)
MQGFKEQPGTPLVCLQNGGGIRADLPAGEVTFGDVTTVLPFGNVVEVLEITGAVLKAALEWGYDSVRPSPCKCE